MSRAFAWPCARQLCTQTSLVPTREPRWKSRIPDGQSGFCRPVTGWASGQHRWEPNPWSQGFRPQIGLSYPVPCTPATESELGPPALEAWEMGQVPPFLLQGGLSEERPGAETKGHKVGVLPPTRHAQEQFKGLPALGPPSSWCQFEAVLSDTGLES